MRIIKILLLSFFLFFTWCYKFSDVEFKPKTISKITTTPITAITSTTAVSGGNVISVQTIISKGVCWSTTQNPTVSLVTKTVEGTGTGVFTSSLKDLKPNTTYYVKAYATDSIGTTIYGNQISFITSSLVTTGIYYVSKTGSNSNNGSINNPFATLSYACTKVTKIGEIIHVNAGTYIETSTSNLSVGVSIEGENRSTTIIKFSEITNKYAILLSSNGSNINGNQHISNIKLQSFIPYVAFAGIGVINRGNVEICNCDISDFNYYGIALHNGEQSGNYAVNNKIHDNIITNCSGYIGGDSKGALDILSQDGLLIYNNNIINARPGGNNGNCIDGVEGFIKNMKIYNNTLQKTFVYGTTAWDFCIEIWNWEGGNEIHNNIISGSIDVQFASKGTSSYSVWIHDNVIGQPVLLPKQGVRGVLLEIWNHDVIIERNYIHHVCQGVFMRGKDDGVYNHSNITIRYNIFDNIGVASGGSAPSPSGWGFYCSETTGYDDVVNNFSFYNNVVIASKLGLTTCWGVSIPDHGTATNINISNNIIQGFASAPIVACGWNQGTKADQVKIFNNIFYGNGNSNNPNLTYKGFTATNVTGLSTNLKTVPPFVSLTNYHLTVARNGYFIMTGLKDKDNVLIGNPPEIGAYEYY